MDGLVLPAHIEQAFAVGYHCRRCCRLNPVVTMFYPLIRREGDHIVLTYPLRCTCRAAGGCTVRLSILAFGYALAWVEIAKGRRRSKRESQVTPGKSATLDKICREYSELIRRCHAGSDGPNSQDRLSLGMNEQEWSQFLKRMGDAPANEAEDD